jgi:FKBP-type peptidyl-prolyl cis-trans isomerase FkpA
MKSMLFKGLTLNLILLSGLWLVQGCGNSSVERNKPAVDSTGEAIIRMNQYLIKKDDEIIKAYAKRHNYDLKVNESGLWYQIYKSGHGPLASNGKTVTIKYKCELIDGTLCYSSDLSGLKSFIVGARSVESGLDEGILLMKQGDVAHLFIPPHLAYGLTGDEKKIPPDAILVYDIELVSIK